MGVGGGGRLVRWVRGVGSVPMASRNRGDGRRRGWDGKGKGVGGRREECGRCCASGAGEDRGVEGRRGMWLLAVLSVLDPVFRFDYIEVGFDVGATEVEERGTASYYCSLSHSHSRSHCLTKVKPPC